MTEINHLTMAALEAGLDSVRQSPKDEGIVELIVRRPQMGERHVVETGELDSREGLVGDNWLHRGSPRTADGLADPDTQLTIMNSRLAALVAQEKGRWPMAGDQLFVDMDLSTNNLPPGLRLAIG